MNTPLTDAADTADPSSRRDSTGGVGASCNVVAASERFAVWQDDPVIRKLQRRTVTLLVSAQIVGGVGIGTAGALSALLAEAVTHSESLAGVARTTTTLGAAVVALPLAMLARSGGRRSALSLGWLIAAIGGALLVASAAATSIFLLVLGMAMFGCAQAVNLQSRYAAVDLARPMGRGKTLSIVVWSTTVGSVAGPNLAGPGAHIARWFGLPDLAGGFLISAVVLTVGALLMFGCMRPDPLKIAQLHSETAKSAGQRPRSFRTTFLALKASRRALFAFVAIALAHAAMAAVMTMTPVHMINHGMNLTLVGLVISVHVSGMFAFSPVVGWLNDRIGSVTTVMIGEGVFVAAAIFGISSGGDMTLLMLCLFLVGLGWSFALIAASALLVETVPTDIRPTVQGTSDMVMNLMAAAAAGGSGFIQAWFGFGGLNVTVLVLVAPPVLMGLWLIGERTRVRVFVRD